MTKSILRTRSGKSSGHSIQQHLVLVSFTCVEDTIRLLSARKATRQERKDYEENVSS